MRVLLYYFYAPIERPELFREQHHELCLRLGLMGRIIVAPEGINGTVSGTEAQTDAYMKTLRADPRFAAIEFKIEACEAHVFQKLIVRVKSEIVHSGLQHIDPNQRTGVHLSPAEFKAMKEGEDVVLLDVRSNYEHQLGRFKGAQTLDIDHFREFPEKVKELGHFKEKKILTYCTGGIKCEKASAYLLEQGFENVYQLHGGIIKYGLEEGGEDFEGNCYVFDERVSVPVNKVNPTLIAECPQCGTKTARVINCASPLCNKQFYQCESCSEQMEGTCSDPCHQDENRRPYDGSGQYRKERQGYDPAMNAKRLAVKGT